MLVDVLVVMKRHVEYVNEVMVMIGSGGVG